MDNNTLMVIRQRYADVCRDWLRSTISVLQSLSSSASFLLSFFLDSGEVRPYAWISLARLSVTAVVSVDALAAATAPVPATIWTGTQPPNGPASVSHISI